MHYIILSSFRQLIYNYPEQLFADNGVMAIEHADFEGVERLALVTGDSITVSKHNVLAKQIWPQIHVSLRA